MREGDVPYTRDGHILRSQRRPSSLWGPRLPLTKDTASHPHGPVYLYMQVVIYPSEKVIIYSWVFFQVTFLVLIAALRAAFAPTPISTISCTADERASTTILSFAAAVLHRSLSPLILYIFLLNSTTRQHQARTKRSGLGHTSRTPTTLIRRSDSF